MRPTANPSSQSFWIEKETSVARDVNTSSPLHDVDVLIIGAGMSGISTAYWLKKMANKMVLVLDARGIAEAASGRNGGHMWPATRPPSEENIARWGSDQMWRVFDFDYDCMTLVETFLRQTKVDCGYKTTGAVLLARFAEEVVMFRQIRDKIRAIRPNIVLELWDAQTCQRETQSKLYIGGLYQPAAGQFVPPGFVRGVAAEAQKLGLKIRTGISVESVTQVDQDGAYVVRTSAGSLRASCVIYATNAYTSSLLPQLTTAITPVRGQMIVTEPLSIRWRMSMSMNDGYEYMLQTPDGRAVVGGMRWRANRKEVGIFDDSRLNTDVSAGLRELLSDSFPALRNPPPKVEHEWTGIMGFSADGQPLVGPLSTHPLLPFSGEYIIAGFTGHGMPRCFLAGKAIAEMVFGQLNPQQWIKPFLPARFLKSDAAAALPLKSPFSSTSSLPKSNY